MFDANANIIIEEDGNITNLPDTIPVVKLVDVLPALAKQYKAEKIHLIGSNQYVAGIASNLKNKKLKFSHYEIEVN